MGQAASLVLDALVQSGEVIKKADKTGRVWFSLASEAEQVALAPSAPAETKHSRPRGIGDWQPSAEMRAWAKAEFGIGDALFDAHVSFFRDYAASKGATYKSWDAAFRNAVRGDWGDVRKKWKPGAATTAMPGLANW